MEKIFSLKVVRILVLWGYLVVAVPIGDNLSVWFSEKMSFRGSSASEFLDRILSDVALNARRANTFADTYKNMKNTINNQRISKSGVDEDEEALNLVKFQYNFNLASKMIQVLTEIYDQLILQTGV